MYTQKQLIGALIKSLEYYANSNDQGKIARRTLEVVEAFKEAEELDEADVYEIEQANHGFCCDICLPKNLKFIEV